MSFRVGTPNYGLPQTEGTDKRDWSDTNQPFLVIDTAIKNAVDTSASASSAAATAQTTADSANTAAAHAQTDATTAQTLATSASELATMAKNTADANTAAIAQLRSNLPLTHSHREMSNGRTCAQIFGALATVFNSLTEQEKIGAKLVYGNTASVNRSVWSMRGMNANGGIFSSAEAAYITDDSTYMLGGNEASISIDSTQCYQASDKVKILTTSPYTVINLATAKIESADVIGSVSDTHYYELVW